MRAVVAVALVSILSGCPGPKGDPGPAGPQGPAGTNGSNGMNGMNGMDADGGLTGVASNCTPAQSFCDGSRLWTCTRSGTDATGGQDCAASGTTNNPSVCSTTQCPYYSNQGACCRPTKATCDWNISGPTSMVGMLFGSAGATSGTYCGAPAPSPIGCVPTTGTFQINLGAARANACPAASDGVLVQIDRTKATVGQGITLPLSGVTFYYTTANDPSKTCYTWTGTLTWNSDVPSYKVTLNLTCSEVGKTGITVTGTIQGDV